MFLALWNKIFNRQKLSFMTNDNGRRKPTPAERNAGAARLLNSILKEVKDKKIVPVPKTFSGTDIELLFSNKIWGHRENVLTVILARMLDNNFRASVDFYACNPRALYEGPIRKFFEDNNIPHKKSGPLNVAKNALKLNDEWAANKRGDGLADVVVRTVKAIESAPREVLEEFARAYVFRYLQEAHRVAELKVDMSPEGDPDYLNYLCSDMIDSVPDGGATPQMIVGLLLEATLKENGSSTELIGLMDSAHATNTTSGKPGDLIERLPDGVEKIYEVTVKKFDLSRAADSQQAVSAYANSGSISEVSVICLRDNVPEEASKSRDQAYLIGHLEYGGLKYRFIDIYAWVAARIHALSVPSRKKFHTALADRVNDINTSEEVKVFFGDWHEQHRSKI